MARTLQRPLLGPLLTTVMRKFPPAETLLCQEDIAVPGRHCCARKTFLCQEDSHLME